MNTYLMIEIIGEHESEPCHMAKYSQYHLLASAHYNTDFKIISRQYNYIYCVATAILKSAMMRRNDGDTITPPQ